MVKFNDFEYLCDNVYNYFKDDDGRVSCKNLLLMLHSMGCVWSEDELNIKDEYISFTDFRRLAKLKWYNKLNDGSQNNTSTHHLSNDQVKELEDIFNNIMKFYNLNNTIPIDLLYKILTDFGNQLDTSDLRALLSKLYTYEDNVTIKSVINLLDQREVT